MEPLRYDHDVETVVGNGRLIARVRAGSAAFVFAGPADGYRLLVDGEPVDPEAVTTHVRPGQTRYEIAGRGAVTASAQPDAPLMALLVESPEAATWTLELTGETVETGADGVETARGGARAWAPKATPGAAPVDDATGTLTVRLGAGGRAAFLLGAADVDEAFPGDPFGAVDAWAEGYASRGLRLRTPAPDLDRAVEFAKVHMQLGYAWEPDADGGPGGEGSMMVCDIFRWRDVWSRDFGSGFGPGGLVAGMVPAVLATLDYEAARHAAADPSDLKVSDDTSQGGSAEGLGWILKLIWRTFKHTGDWVWLERMVDTFEPWIETWIARDTDGDGLIVDVTEWMDHSRFLRLVEGQRTLYSNALYFAALRRMAFITDALGRDEAAERYRDLAARSRTAIHDAFWNETGYFNNAVQWGVPDTTLMLADNAIAVVERIASRNERFRTLETLRERSWRPYGTVTTDLPMRYVPADNDHNGKVWPWWMAHEAKARFQNFDAEGGLHVVSKIVDTFAWPTFPGLCEEYCNPDDGSQDDVVGHTFITGSGALLDAVQYGMLGLSVREPGERHVRLAPAVPRTWEDWSADIDLVQGRLRIDQSPDGYGVVLDDTRVETLELRIPPREAVEVVLLNGEEVEPERDEDGASAYLRFALPRGGRHVISVGFAQSRVLSGEFAMPALPPPVPVERPLLMDEPRLFADVLQGFIRAAVSFFGRMRHMAAREIGDLEGGGDLLVIVGNELPHQTKRGASVTDMVEGFLDRGGSLLLLGPRFPRIDFENHYHGGAQMGGHAGMFWWKVWRDGHWVDYDPRDNEVLPHPVHEGAVYWGEGPLFAAWEHGIGLFGFETDCRGVFDVEGGTVDPDQRVEIVYTDWTVKTPWSFTPLAFTEREHQLVTGPRRERYPCAALLQNAESGARIVVVAPSVCSRADLLHHILAHVAAPA
ncbi:MAG: GH116 family glycosyl hydrolase [Bacteroidota bacterium]